MLCFTFTRTIGAIVLFLITTWLIAGNLSFSLIKAQFKAKFDETRQQTPLFNIERNSTNHSKVALLIEPRPIRHLAPQILHMISVVPLDWSFVFVGSGESVSSLYRSRAVRKQQTTGKLNLLVLPEPWEIDNKEKVDRLLADIRFYDEFLPRAKWILKYEYDSILCANSEKSLNDWLRYDWASLPSYNGDGSSSDEGLSLRRVSTIKRVLESHSRYDGSSPEEEWFRTRISTLPNTRVASNTRRQLAMKGTYFPSLMGFHVGDSIGQPSNGWWDNSALRMKILNYCPELSIIMDMKLEKERCDGAE
ncbi:hypothetical protein F4677DRAFT_446091 [Hypoxylon crocopeplum]|nr:hypothetical protein F4677DRAFT_446091 [Hypoxylon crocopeplum]